MNKTGQNVKSGSNLLSIYITSDYPEKGDTTELILALQAAGVDMIEVGIPYSDPLADGPVIQDSSQKALANGFSVTALFEDLLSIKSKVHIPLIPMGYFNTMLRFGLERFLNKCQSLDIDTVIIPDLPLDLYETQYAALFREKGVHPVFLISQQTSTERIRRIDDLSEAFIYVVADNSITGSKSGISKSQLEYFERIKKMELKNPTIIGFGISDNASFTNACQYANGAIIGSAFIRSLSAEGFTNEHVKHFIDGIHTSAKITS